MRNHLAPSFHPTPGFERDGVRGEEFLPALRAFTADYDGNRVRIGAGENVHPRHPIVYRYPEHFGRASAAVGKARRAQRTSSTRRSTRTETVAVPYLIMHNAQPTRPRTIHLAGDAREAIAKEVARWNGRVETGGLLIGQRDGRFGLRTTHACTRVHIATDAGGGNVVRGPSKLHPDPDALQRLATQYACDGEVIGRWHSHPSGSDEVSNADRSVIRNAMTEGDMARWVELIVTTNMDGCGWVSPHITAWVAHRDRGVIERGSLVDSWGS